MKAPCIIDTGAFCGPLARPVTTLIVGFTAFMATVGQGWFAVQYSQLAFSLVATCLKVSGVKPSGVSNVTPPWHLVVVRWGEAEQGS